VAWQTLLAIIERRLTPKPRVQDAFDDVASTMYQCLPALEGLRLGGANMEDMAEGAAARAGAGCPNAAAPLVPDLGVGTDE
jgi:hypothetical protein